MMIRFASLTDVSAGCIRDSVKRRHPRRRYCRSKIQGARRILDSCWAQATTGNAEIFDFAIDARLWPFRALYFLVTLRRDPKAKIGRELL
jgi:hypothetical protein